MEKSIFGCWGHAFNRKFYYTSHDGMYNEFTIPGGAAFIQQLLNLREGTAYKPLDSAFLCEHHELKQFEEKQTKTKYYAVSRRLGYVKGHITPASCEAAYALVFDADMGAVSLPDEDIPVLWASNKSLPDKGLFDKIARRCLLLLEADVLRNKGAMISKSISWERSAENLLWQLAYNPQFNHLLKAPHLLITFAEDGAIYIKTENGKLSKAWLTLTHNGLEGSLREKRHGENDDVFLLMTAAALLQFPEVITNRKTLSVRPLLQLGAKQKMSGFQLGSFEDQNYLIDSFIASSDTPDGIQIPIVNGVPVNVNTWVIASDKYKNDMFGLAENYVKTGKISDNDFPMLSIGNLKTIDRGEIEAFSNISNVIKTYYYTANPDKPLSIAVFGKPGSGKSFGVKQIAKFVLPKDTMKDITFNVSQFSDDPNDLGECFQQVRDIILKGLLPLVFFDEFDSDGKKWLKNFLMPMQDGKFKDQSGEHPLGKCILVFAGGTASTFEEFCSGMDTEAAKALKIPDFVSRIKGSIDIAGPNQRNGEDENFVLRRALLLRALCEKDPRLNEKSKGFIDDTIVRALLLVPQFKHGARSVETLLDMSDITSGKWGPATLPLGDQLSLHVNTRAFTDLILFDVIINEPLGLLAKQIHQNYVTDMTAKGLMRSNVKPWDKLSYHFKLSNLNLARSYADKMALLGYVIELKTMGKPAIKKFTKEQVDLLAEEEHERWIKEKIADGWVYNAVKNDRKKHHDCLVEWDKLTKEQKKWDVKTVEEMIPLLDNIGFGVYKTD